MDSQRIDQLARHMAERQSRRSVLRRMAVGVIALAGLAANRGGVAAGFTCGDQQPCGAGRVCVDGACLGENGTGCGYSNECASDYCGSNGNPEYECGVDIDPVGCTCIDPVCKGFGLRCSSDGDCCGGIACVDGWCTAARADLTMHYRCCPEGATDLYAECHPHGISGVVVDIWWAGDATVGIVGGERTTDANGDVIFPELDKQGPWQVSADLPGAPIAIYCADEAELGAERYLDVSGGITLPGLSSRVVCDVYYTGVCDAPTDGEDGGEEPGGDTELPDTGSGGSATSLIAGAAIVAGGAALLGKALKGNAEA